MDVLQSVLLGAYVETFRLLVDRHLPQPYSFLIDNGELAESLSRAAIKMRDQCATIFRQAKKELEAAGLVSDDKATTGTSNSHSEDSLATEIDKELENLHGKTGPEVISKLEELLVKSQALKHGLARAKRVKLVRSELNRAKKILANTDSSHSDGENESSDVKSASTQSSNSPSGVNRRTAVLFTRKAQAALKKPDGNEEKELNTPSNKQ